MLKYLGMKCLNLLSRGSAGKNKCVCVYVCWKKVSKQQNVKKCWLWMMHIQMIFIILFRPLYGNGPTKILKSEVKQDNYPKLYPALIFLSFISFLMMIYLFSF